MPEAPTETLRLVPVRQAAEYIAVTRRTIERAINRGDLTAYRLGARCTRVDLDELIDLMRAQGGRDA